MVCMHYACIYRNAANWFPDMQKRDMFLYKHTFFFERKCNKTSFVLESKRTFDEPPKNYSGVLNNRGALITM